MKEYTIPCVARVTVEADRATGSPRVIVEVWSDAHRAYVLIPPSYVVPQLRLDNADPEILADYLQDAFGDNAASTALRECAKYARDYPDQQPQGLALGFDASVTYVPTSEAAPVDFRSQYQNTWPPRSGEGRTSTGVRYD